ncbi:unnamed protein product, partial [Aphanomyces euteiches]
KHMLGCPSSWIYDTHEQLSEMIDQSSDPQSTMLYDCKLLLDEMQSKLIEEMSNMESRLQDFIVKMVTHEIEKPASATSSALLD